MTSDSTGHRCYKDIIFEINGPILDENDDSERILSNEEVKQLLANMSRRDD